MPDPTTIERLRGLVLSANDLRVLIDWPDALIEDYLNIVDNLILLANILDVEIDQKIEEIPTDFTNGSVPFVKSNLLVEDNTNLIWNNITKVLTLGGALLKNLTASRLIASDGNKNVVSVANLASWIAGTINQILITNDGDGTVTISIPDTNVTGAELETLTDNSMADTLHRHSELSASDGDPDACVSVGADGAVTLVGTARVERHTPLGAGRLVKHGNNDPTLNDEGLYTTEDFAAAATQELFYEKNVPYRWDDTTDMEVEIFWMLDANEANDALFVRWGISYKSTEVGEAVTGAGTSFTQDTNTLSAVAGILLHTTMTTKMLVANMDYHEALAIRVYRDGPNDDAVGAARLIAVRVHFIMNKFGQAT